jgi:hypothetical protein
MGCVLGIFKGATTCSADFLTGDCCGVLARLVDGEGPRGLNFIFKIGTLGVSSMCGSKN